MSSQRQNQADRYRIVMWKRKKIRDQNRYRIQNLVRNWKPSRSQASAQGFSKVQERRSRTTFLVKELFLENDFCFTSAFYVFNYGFENYIKKKLKIFQFWELIENKKSLKIGIVSGFILRGYEAFVVDFFILSRIMTKFSLGFEKFFFWCHHEPEGFFKLDVLFFYQKTEYKWAKWRKIW